MKPVLELPGAWVWVELESTAEAEDEGRRCQHAVAHVMAQDLAAGRPTRYFSLRDPDGRSKVTARCERVPDPSPSRSWHIVGPRNADPFPAHDARIQALADLVGAAVDPSSYPPRRDRQAPSTASAALPTTTADSLREQAMALLRQAELLDGLKPYFIFHQHEYGGSAYLAWSTRPLREVDAASVLDCEFEPERGETLYVEDQLTLDELVGISPGSRITVVEADAEVPEEPLL